MTEAEYKEFVKAAYDGAILIGVDRAFARRFYTTIPLSKIEDETGEAPYFEKMVVWSAFLGGPMALLVSSILAVDAFRWWAALVVPFCALVWVIYYTQSVRSDSRMITAYLFVVLAGALHFSGLFKSPKVTLFLLAFTISLFCARSLYCSATYLLRCFVLRSFKAFTYLSDHLVIRNAARSHGQCASDRGLFF